MCQGFQFKVYDYELYYHFVYLLFSLLRTALNLFSQAQYKAQQKKGLWLLQLCLALLPLHFALLLLWCLARI